MNNDLRLSLFHELDQWLPYGYSSGVLRRWGFIYCFLQDGEADTPFPPCQICKDEVNPLDFTKMAHIFEFMFYAICPNCHLRPVSSLDTSLEKSHHTFQP